MVQSAPTAKPDPSRPALSAQEYELAVRQEQLDALMAEVERVIARERLSALGAFAYDVEGKALLVRWVGPVPDALVSLDPPTGYALRFLPASYTEGQLRAANEQVLRMLDDRQIPGRLVSLGIRPDCTGLDLVLDERTIPADRLPQVPASVPVHVTAGPPITPLTTATRRQ